MLLVLSFLTTTINAKSLPAFSVSPSPTTDLSERLAADKDFQQFTISTFCFLEKIKESKAENLFEKIIMSTATNDESSLFWTKLGYSSKVDVSQFFYRAINLRRLFQEKFPEIILKSSTKEDNIRKAILNVLIEKGNLKYPPSDCWVAWSISLSACSQYCALQEEYTYESCFFACAGPVSALAGVCFIYAD